MMCSMRVRAPFPFNSEGIGLLRPIGAFLQHFLFWYGSSYGGIPS